MSSVTVISASASRITTLGRSGSPPGSSAAARKVTRHWPSASVTHSKRRSAFSPEMVAGKLAVATAIACGISGSGCGPVTCASQMSATPEWTGSFSSVSPHAVPSDLSLSASW